MLLQIINQYLRDGGPVYAETQTGTFFVEPFNAISSLAILLPAVYWSVKLKFDFRNYPFIFLGIPLLLLGGIGSTLYHAFRSSVWLLYLDVLPSAILTLLVGIYFWVRLFRKWYWGLYIFLPLTAIRFFLLYYIDGEFGVNMNYFLTGTLIFLPIVIYLFTHSFRYASSIFISIVMLILALVFRELDSVPITFLPMGTHFLWHLLSGIGAYYLAEYLYLTRREELHRKLH